MARNRFVQPEQARIYLADVHRRAHHDLITLGRKENVAGLDVFIPATPAEISESAARVAEAEADGDWIDVKKELNAGEQRRVFTGLVKTMQAGENALLDPEKVGKTKLMGYIVAWSLCDATGKSVPFSASALDAIDTETYRELVMAIDAHEEDIEKVRAERKNARTGENTSKAISPSVVG